MVTYEKVQKYHVCFTTESLPLNVMVMHKFSNCMAVIGESLGDSISVVGEGVGEVPWTNK